MELKLQDDQCIWLNGVIVMMIINNSDSNCISRGSPYMYDDREERETWGFGGREKEILICFKELGHMILETLHVQNLVVKAGSLEAQGRAAV